MYLATTEDTNITTTDSENIEVVLPNSTLYNLLSAIKTALGSAVGVGLVTEDWTTYSQESPEDLPRVHVGVDVEDYETIAFWHDTAFDTQGSCTLTLEIAFYSSEDVNNDMDEFRRQIEEKMYSVSEDGLLGILKQSSEYVFDDDQNFGLMTEIYTMMYLYNHNRP